MEKFNMDKLKLKNSIACCSDCLKLAAEILENKSVQQGLNEIITMPRQEFKDGSNFGFVYHSRGKRSDLGNYCYAVLYVVVRCVSKTPAREQEFKYSVAKTTMDALEARYTSLGSKDSQDTLLKGDVWEYILSICRMTGPAVPTEVREDRILAHGLFVKWWEHYQRLLLACFNHAAIGPPTLRFLPPFRNFAMCIVCAPLLVSPDEAMRNKIKRVWSRYSGSCQEHVVNGCAC
jgi:hypothetical protein